MERFALILLATACGGSVELGRPNDPPEWPMTEPAVLPAPAPVLEDPSATPAAPVTEPEGPAPAEPPVEEPPETE